MTKTVLDIGNCDPDHHALKSMLTSRYDATLVRAHELKDALAFLNSKKADLILINRKLDIDYSDGIDVLKAIKSDPDLQSIPVMIVTNYPEHQEAAVDAGAEYGFGKLQYGEASTHDRLAQFLSAK